MKPYTRSALPALAMVAALAALPAQAGTTGLDPQLIERGRYIARIAGCNDCHTSGYVMSAGKIDESLWLSGDSFGWRGPWGTTYGSNLRLFVKEMTEDAWVEVARSLRRRPPMPWFNLNDRQESDLRALYQFIHSLGDAGQPAPAYVPPDVEPDPPYATFPATPPVL